MALVGSGSQSGSLRGKKQATGEEAVGGKALARSQVVDVASGATGAAQSNPLDSSQGTISSPSGLTQQELRDAKAVLRKGVK